MMRTMIAALAGLAALSACSSDDEDTYVARDVEVLYNLGQDNLQKQRWKFAAAAFDEVERQHPYSVWARRAQLMGAYAYYMDDEYDDAILAAERFLALHPGNANAGYAHYLIAISHYEQISDVHRDQKATEQAQQSLLEVVRRYPNTDYAHDAQLKLDLTQDHLAAKEMEVGRFYLDQEHYLAAIGRFKGVVEAYETTSHVPEALHRLVEAYAALGVQNEAERYGAVLGHNYPDSRWYRYSYSLLTGKELKEDKKGFLAQIFGG